MPDPFTHMILYPVQRLPHETIDCVPGAHTGWAINSFLISPVAVPHEVYSGYVGPERDVATVLSELFDAYPEMDNMIQIRWIDEADTRHETKIGTIMDVMAELMETICDETPDDAPNTDDHPLEEARTILDALDSLRSPSPAP